MRVRRSLDHEIQYRKGEVRVTGRLTANVAVNVGPRAQQLAAEAGPSRETERRTPTHHEKEDA